MPASGRCCGRAAASPSRPATPTADRIVPLVVSEEVVLFAFVSKVQAQPNVLRPDQFGDVYRVVGQVIQGGLPRVGDERLERAQPVNPLEAWRWCYATSALSWAVGALRCSAIWCSNVIGASPSLAVCRRVVL